MDRLIAFHGELAEENDAQPGQQVHATSHRMLATASEGLWQAFQGDPEEARRLLSEASPHLRASPGFVARWILAGVLERDRPREALRLLERMEGGAEGYARVRMGRTYESLGEPDRARESYAAPLQRFVNADPDLPYLVQARRAVRRGACPPHPT